MGKGDKRRPMDEEKFRRHYDLIDWKEESKKDAEVATKTGDT